MSDEILAVAKAIGLASRSKDDQFVSKHWDRVADADSLEIKRALERQAIASLSTGVGLSGWPDSDRTFGKGDNKYKIGDWFKNRGSPEWFAQIRGIAHQNAGTISIFQVRVRDGKHLPSEDQSTYAFVNDFLDGYEYVGKERPFA